LLDQLHKIRKFIIPSSQIRRLGMALALSQVPESVALPSSVVGNRKAPLSTHDQARATLLFKSLSLQQFDVPQLISLLKQHLRATAHLRPCGQVSCFSIDCFASIMHRTKVGPSATLNMRNESITRVFKTAWFSKAAGKVNIGDAALIAAMRDVMRGQAEDLGGGVFKKRLNSNMHRSIVLAKGGRLWIFAYLFAKSDRANIESAELGAFKKLAEFYGQMTEVQLTAALRQGELTELCDDD